MTDHAPTVSVIMAAYNGASLIGETLDTLARQSFTDFEVVVVDDCSTDDTRDIVRAYPDARVRLIAAPVNGGPVRARNIALSHARGRYIAALDQDDLCHPDRLARQVAWLDADPGCVLVATDATVLYKDAIQASQLPPNTTPALIGWLIHVRNPLVWSSVMIRGDAARSLDPFGDPDRLYAEDFDIYHRLSQLGRIARIDAPLVTYRCHAGGASKRYTTTMLANAAVVLAEAYGPALGDDAADAARLVAEHIMAATPVPDRSTLQRLGEALTRLQIHHLATTRPSPEDAKLIRWETARLWWRIGRRSIRSGRLGLRDALAVRPDHLGLGHANIDDLLMTGVIGRFRARGHRAAAE